MDLEEALDRLANAEDYIDSLRHQIRREREDLRDKYEWHIAHLRSENESLIRMLTAPSLLQPMAPTIIPKVEK